jgi:hypothetical protein
VEARQALLDAGVIEGIPSAEADELAAAHRRIAALEAELALTRDACELFDELAVVPPKRRRAIAEGLVARGHSARSACWITGLAPLCCNTIAYGQYPIARSAGYQWGLFHGHGQADPTDPFRR